jgi:hypothetical protein
MLFGKSDFIRSNSNVHVEFGGSHIILHGHWCNVNWDSLGERRLLSLLLLKSNFIRAYKDFHVKFCLSHGILHSNWINMHWNSLLLS